MHLNIKERNEMIQIKKIVVGILFVATVVHATFGMCESKIGVILPLTGPLAEYGTAMKNGIEMAVNESPLANVKLKFIFEDSQYDPKIAVSAYQKLSEIDKVSVIYNFGGPTSAAIVPLADQKKIPTLLWTTDETVVKNSTYAMRFTNSADEFMAKLLSSLTASHKKHFAVVLTDNLYLKSLYEAMKRNLMPDQTLDIIDTYQATETDFRSSVTKLKGKSYDAIGVFLLSGQVNQFYRQMHQQKIIATTFGTDFFESSTEIKLSSGGMEGSTYANNSVSESFKSHYVEQFKNALQLTYAGSGYEFVKLVATLEGTSEEKIKHLQYHMKPRH